MTLSKGPSINDVSFEIKGGGVKNGILRRFLGLKLRRQGEGGGFRNPKIEETSFMDVPLGDKCGKFKFSTLAKNLAGNLEDEN